MPDIHLPHLHQHNVEAEQAVLGALILNGHMIATVLDSGLSQTDFFAPPHRTIFFAMQNMAKKGLSIDGVTISDELKRCDMLDDVGGQAYMQSLISVSGAKPLNLLDYAWLVRKAALERRLGDSAIGVAGMIDGRDSLPADARPVIDRMDKLVRTLAARNKTDEMGDSYERVLGRITGEIPDEGTLDTGLYKLNKLLNGGLRRSDLAVIAARTGQGKSALAATICRHVAVKLKLSVVLYSYEMSIEQMIQRMLAAMTGIALARVQKGNFTEDEQHLTDKLVESLAVLSDSPLSIVEASGMDSDELNGDIVKRAGAKGGLALACVDYIGLVSVPDRLQRQSRATQVGATTTLLKQAAGKGNCCVLALSQLNRLVEHRGDDPQLSDLRDSGDTEQNANQVIFLYDLSDKQKQMQSAPEGFKTQWLDCQKSRNGETGRTQIYYRGAFTRYQDWPGSTTDSVNEYAA